TLEVKVRFLQGEEEREILLPSQLMASLLVHQTFHFRSIEAEIEAMSELVAAGVHRFTVSIANTSPASGDAMQSVHTLLRIEHGEFVSLADPPEDLRAIAGSCRNFGTWPILAGPEGDHSLMLSSPIILYDHPQVAPESPGDFFDGTEMDEMLTLRVLTLSEA